MLEAKRFAMSAATLFLLALPLTAQVDTGVITGVVTDASGAVIPGATVQVIGEETQITYELQTNASGLYASPGLRTGSYQVTASMEGFRTENRTGVAVRVQDRAQVDFILEIGSTQSEVTVTAAAPLLESQTSSLGQVIEENTIVSLPLNGRNFINLALLGAGVLPSRRTAERDNFIANGARAVQNTYLLDGVENKNHIAGFDTSAAQVIQPHPDMIQEFKVQTSTFSAEFGQSAGGVVNVTMKSGSNEIHGSLFEFLRNDKFQATPYFQPAGGGKPQFRQNQFGAAVGGPFIKNRTFWFATWQSSRSSSTAPGFATVPNAGQREGDFGSRAMFDPDTFVASSRTREQFANNVIPRSRWDRVSAQLMPLYPLPNLPGAANNFFSNQKQVVNANQYAARVDHQFSPRDVMFVRANIQQDENLLPALMPPPANDINFVFPRARSAALSETHTFSGAMTNEFRLGMTRSYLNQDIEGANLFEQFGITGAPVTAEVRGLPTFPVAGFSQLGTTGPGVRPIPATGSGNLPITKTSMVWQIADNFSWINGRHAFKFGGDVQWVAMNTSATLSARPAFNFDGRFTNNPQQPAGTGLSIGDLLLGFPQNVNLSTRSLSGIRQRIFQAYVQDDWKATSKLTVNLGVRYELPMPFFEVNDLQSNFILEADSPAFLTVLDASDAARGGLGRSLVQADRNNWAPRVGFAYSVTPKTVIRSAFGVFYGRDENIGVNRRLVNNPPYFIRTTFPTSQTATNIKLDEGLPPDAVDPVRVQNPEVNSYPREYDSPYVLQWNFNIERQVMANTILQVGYTGSGGRKLYFPLDWNRPEPGAGNINARRPYPGYSGIFNYSPIVRSSYNAMLVKLERRFSAGLSLLASYTYGHSLDNSRSQNDQGDPGPMNVRNIDLEHASSNYDIKHRFVYSYVWELPFGKGRRFLSDNAVGRAILGGWQVSGVFALQSGLPYTVTLNRDPSNSGSPGRPDRMGHGALPSDERTLQRYFNIGAFVDPSVNTPGVFRFGNSGRSILRGPGQFNMDLGVARDFNLNERLRLQFRTEFFNFTNTPQFGVPAAAIGNAQAGIINSVVNPERQIQFALKLLF